MIILKVQEQVNQWIAWLYQVNHLNPIISTLTDLGNFSLESIEKSQIEFSKASGKYFLYFKKLPQNTIQYSTDLRRSTQGSEAAST